MRWERMAGGLRTREADGAGAGQGGGPRMRMAGVEVGALICPLEGAGGELTVGDGGGGGEDSGSKILWVEEVGRAAGTVAAAGAGRGAPGVAKAAVRVRSRQELTEDKTSQVFNFNSFRTSNNRFPVASIYAGRRRHY